MTLRNQAQLENTKRKLSELENLYNKRKNQPADNDYARKLTLSSLKRLINQLKEEIARYEAKSPAKTE
jgi:hypothetical protein